MEKSTQPQNGGPAFPLKTKTAYFPGMSLRAYFAGQALIALPHIGCGADLNAPELAEDAIRIADALIAELNKSHV